MMYRSFIAIELPREIQRAIVADTAALQSALPKPLVRWVGENNLHITLKFLGDVSPANLEKLAEALQGETTKHAPFDLSLERIGAFPNSKKARVLWIGIEAPADLGTLQHCVEGVATRLSYPAEERPFSPHLTIGRVNQNASTADLAGIRAALEGCRVGLVGTVRVDAIHIFKSDLLPGGSVYTHLYAMPLQS